MTTSRSDDEPVIRIVAGVAVDGSGRVLLVRKRGTERFMLPGGKLAEGEGASEALARELEEELGCTLAGEPRLLGSFSAPAANEPGHRVDALLFTVELGGVPRACAEIDALDWHDPHSEPAYRLAPLARDHVLPLVRARQKAA
jgi:8-oxo-dGTP diphosphatase